LVRRGHLQAKWKEYTARKRSDRLRKKGFSRSEKGSNRGQGGS